MKNRLKNNNQESHIMTKYMKNRLKDKHITHLVNKNQESHIITKYIENRFKTIHFQNIEVEIIQNVEFEFNMITDRSILPFMPLLIYETII
jgi:hypothetical protein